jgi:aminopeptidase N
MMLIAALVLAPRPEQCNLAWTRPLNPPAAAAGEVPYHPFDVLHYDLVLDVLVGDSQLDGTATLTLTPTEAGVEEVGLNLSAMTVDSVWTSAGQLAFSHSDDSLVVELEGPAGTGDTLDISIAYSGQPWNEGAGGFGGFWFKQTVPVAYQMGVGVYTDPPSVGRAMFPCWDHPSDKATFEFHVSCPDTLYAVANGDLTAVRGDGDRSVYDWELDQPMSTYLAAVSAGDYTVLTDSTYDWIRYYVYEWEVEDALGSFANVDLMMDELEDAYGPYPWDCKFSYVQTPKGDMEHLSQVYHMAMLVNGSTTYDWLLAHEMSHQWWGNCVTESQWSDVWLSEGFATYSEAVWQEHYGQEAYDDYIVNQIMIPYLQSGETFPLAGPSTPSEYWSYTTYEKGASVLHMLRYVVGDDDFFAALDEYFGHHAYGLATTDDLRDHFESVTGEDIDWFFDAWVWGEGYPVYDIASSWQQAGTDWELTVEVEQVQTTPTVFTMPLEFLVEGISQDSVVVMWNDQQEQSETFSIPFEPQAVSFDPYSHILSSHLTGVEDIPVPPAGGAGTMMAVPNPAALSTRIVWSGVEARAGEVELFDLAGRSVRRAPMEAGVSVLDLGGLPSGTYLAEARVEGGLRQVCRLVVVD